MCSHNIFDRICQRLIVNGCRDVDRGKLASLITETLRSISIKNPGKVAEIEEILYSMMHHYAFMNGHLQVPMQTFIYNSTRPNKLSREIKFDTQQLPYSLCQILYTFINDLRNED